MHLFLEGNVGIGKTTMILQELHRLSLKAAGFVSVRLVDVQGETVAFALQDVRRVSFSVERIDRTQIPPEQIFLKGSREHRSADLSVFAREEQFLQDVMQADVVVMDELGSIEMQVDAFYHAVCAALQSQIPCVGTFKSRRNFQHMQQHVSISVHQERAEELRGWMQQTDGQLLACTTENQVEIKQKLECFLEQCRRRNKDNFESNFRR